MGWQLRQEVPAGTGSVLADHECQAPSAPTRIKSQATTVTDLQHILKGVQAGDQEGGTQALGKTGRIASHVTYFQEKILASLRI